MSSQYPYPYPPQQQFPQQPPPAEAAPASIVPKPDLVPAGSTYISLPTGMTMAEARSMQLANIAAGSDALQLAVLIPPAAGSGDFPFLMYSQKEKGVTKAAKDEKEKADLASKGFGENPPKDDPAGVTPEMMQALQDVWTKAGDALKKLTELVQQQQKQMDAASAALNAGQQPQPQQPDPALFQQQPYYPQSSGD